MCNGKTRGRAGRSVRHASAATVAEPSFLPGNESRPGGTRIRPTRRASLLKVLREEDGSAGACSGRLLPQPAALGFFEGIDSERGIAWRAADSLSLRDFLGVLASKLTPDHSTISRTRRLIDLETHQAVFTWVLGALDGAGLIKGKTIGVDATTLEANAAMRCANTRTSPSGSSCTSPGSTSPCSCELASASANRGACRAGPPYWGPPLRRSYACCTVFGAKWDWPCAPRRHRLSPSLTSRPERRSHLHHGLPATVV